jgi:protein-tyrosine phosphatase
MIDRTYWIKGPWPGKLGVAARPRGGDWLSDEVANWRRQRIHTVVSLLTPEEEREFSLENEGEQTRSEGINFVAVPVCDRQVPDSESEIQAVVRQLDEDLSGGRNVLIHCRQGIGRSGLLAACLLINRGRSPEAALQDISEVRGAPVPETSEQRRWIDQYAADLHAEPQR